MNRFRDTTLALGDQPHALGHGASQAKPRRRTRLGIHLGGWMVGKVWPPIDVRPR